MPSTILSAASGAPFPLISGNPWSGQGFPHPVGSILFRLSPSSSGNAYISLSGGTTVNSGGFFLSGGGLGDGMPVFPGGELVVPRLGLVSGQPNIYVTCDPACSGQARLYWEAR